MAFRQFAALHAQLHAARQPARAGDVTHHASPRSGLLDLLPTDVVNAVYAQPGVGGAGERQLREDLRLLQSVGSGDVERRVDFLQSAFLRLAQSGGEVGATLFHSREDVIAGPVDDSCDALDRVAGEPALDRPDDRDAAANAGLESDPRARRRGSDKEFTPGICQKGLVRRDHISPEAQGSANVSSCRMHAADQLHEQIAVINHVDRVRRQQRSVDSWTRLPNIANENASNAQIHALTCADPLPFSIDELDEALTDGAASQESDGYFAHASLLTTRACSRSSIRSRTSSSPTESRIRPSPMPTLLRTSGSIDACVIVAG